MNDFSRLTPDTPVLPENEHWIDGNHENAKPVTGAMNQYPDDQRVIHNHALHMDDTARVERQKLDAPPDYQGPTDHLLFTTRDRSDHVHLYLTDHPVLDINDQRYHLKMASSGQVIVLRTEGGHDNIRIDDPVKITVFIDSGMGNDRILCGGGFTKVDAGPGNDQVFTRSGSSYVEAGDGDDVVSAQGSGPMTVYGGKGHDTLAGGEGACFMDGGQGDDVLLGGEGHNVLSGSDGNDQITPGPGPNTVYTGTGVDFVEHLGSNTRLFNAYDADGPAPSTHHQDPGVIIAAKGLDSCGVVVEGRQAFQERVNDDLRLLLGSGNGRQLLSALGDARQKSGVAVIVKELTAEENGMCIPDGSQSDSPFDDDSPFIESARPNTPVKGCTVYYDPSFLKGEVTSIVHLYHELCHAYNFVTGTMLPGYGLDGVDAGKPRDVVPNAELQAVGLDVDFDANPATAPLPGNPEAFTENGLRLEFGITPRKQYRED
ncbi:M91 family zinc metallopeptidase [Pseudomonas batumici]|uniref:Hemolysin-type calcium-binding region n=1 Tax=Pseudomonas batumici TaxID=226910 RepID=A0A0C2IAZ7_9PSED|nr:M91 family zinc metallopeptidase [Pseudomonas batumici]KIH82217.1 Hemolysin-type calcium-binding region [Pseudomonas batumici]